MARSIRRSAASTVLPVATQPGRSGTDAPQSLPGSLSMRTRYWNFLMRVLAADLPGAAPRPAFPSASRPRMTADGHPTGFRGVLEMPVTPPTDHQPPAVRLDQTDHVPHLHCHTHPLFPTATAAAALWRRRKSTLLDGPSWGQAAHLSSIGLSAERCVNALRPPPAQQPPVRYDQSPPAREEPECTAGSFRLSTPTRATCATRPTTSARARTATRDSPTRTPRTRRSATRAPTPAGTSSSRSRSGTRTPAAS